MAWWWNWVVEDDRPRLWANPGAKCVEKSPCSFACCAEGRYCEGQCCQDACGVDSKGKPCCKNSAEGQCSIGPHRPSQNLWIVAVLFGVPVFAVVLYALYYYFFGRGAGARSLRTEEALLNSTSMVPMPQNAWEVASTTGSLQTQSTLPSSASQNSNCTYCGVHRQMSRHCPTCHRNQVVCHLCNRQYHRCERCIISDFIPDSVYESEASSQRSWVEAAL